MSDFHLVDPQGWEYDLQSVYSAYMGYFQLHNIPWHDRTWGQFFETFEQFLAFTWPVVTITDTRTSRAHIVTRMSSIISFLKMIKARFGEKLPVADNMLLIKPFETSQRQLRHINDGPSYKKLHAMLPAVALATLKARVKSGDPNAIRQLWAEQDKTFVAVAFECLEGNVRSCVEWGYAAIRSSHLVAAGAWPPIPDTNYRKGHYVISEFADMVKKAAATASWQYAFGESQVIPKAKLPRIIQSVLSLMSPESESVANTFVLVGHGLQVILQRLEEMKIRLPTNVIVLDIAHLERALYTTGDRGAMHDRKTGQVRAPTALLSLGGILRSFGIVPPCVLGHGGNDAFMALVVFQRMVDPKGKVGVFGEAGAGVNAASTGVGAGNGTSKGERDQGRVKRMSSAATLAARLFRPLSVAQPLADAAPPAVKANTVHGHVDPSQRRSRHASVTLGGVDELGAMPTHLKRASVFGSLRPTSMASTEVQKRGASQASAGVSERTLSPPMKRYSTAEKSRG